MNIFWLDSNLEKCAQYHCDKHVVKMPIEYAQLLSTTLIHYGYDAPYKQTHINHPCAIWARKTLQNYQLLYDLALAVGREYTYRYGKVHKSTQAVIDMCPRDISMPNTVIGRTPLPNCTTLKESNPELNLVDKYRLYYMTEKAHILTWKNREEPPFMGDRFYMQQKAMFGTCPGDKTPGRRKAGYGSAPKEKRITKSDLVAQIGIPNIDKLLQKDLVALSLVDLSNITTLSMPEGRLKKPYIEVCNAIHSDVDWSKLTVASLKSVISHFS